MFSPQYSVTPANENVARKGSNGQYLLMWTENKSNKSCSVIYCMISDVVFKHLLGVREIIVSQFILFPGEDLACGRRLHCGFHTRVLRPH